MSCTTCKCGVEFVAEYPEDDICDDCYTKEFPEDEEPQEKKVKEKKPPKPKVDVFTLVLNDDEKTIGNTFLAGLRQVYAQALREHQDAHQRNIMYLAGPSGVDSSKLKKAMMPYLHSVTRAHSILSREHQSIINKRKKQLEKLEETRTNNRIKAMKKRSPKFAKMKRQSRTTAGRMRSH